MFFIKKDKSKLKLTKIISITFCIIFSLVGFSNLSNAYVIFPSNSINKNKETTSYQDNFLPSGSYKDTCSKCTYNFYLQKLSCKCKDDKGNLVNSRSIIRNSCTYVSNKDGFLNCDSYSLYYKKPAGNYLNSCKSCNWNLKTRKLECDSCNYTVIKKKTAKLQVPVDCMQVENVNGSLTCTKKYTHINAKFAWENPTDGYKYLSPGSIYNNDDAPSKCEPITPEGYVWTKQWRTVGYYKHGKFISSVCEYKKAFIPVALNKSVK